MHPARNALTANRIERMIMKRRYHGSRRTRKREPRARGPRAGASAGWFTFAPAVTWAEQPGADRPGRARPPTLTRRLRRLDEPRQHGLEAHRREVDEEL